MFSKYVLCISFFIIKQIRNSKKIKDMSSMFNSFQDLQKAYLKVAPTIHKEETGYWIIKVTLT